MKTNCKAILALLMALIVHFSYAQEKTVTGKVTDDSGLPLPGVNIVIRGTNNGAQSDFDGLYSIQASEGNILVFSYLGFASQEVTVGASNTIDMQLQASTAELDEVVVTALGISREKKSLGYAVQEVDGNAIAQTRSTNALGALTGQVAGVQINNAAGNIGGSTRILIRGAGSITQENRPLIVVDGTPLDNSNYNDEDTQDGGGGRDFGDTGFDINPDDIENISVLKGGAAAALYGNRANNGVIIITTKTAKDGKAEIVVNSGVSFESINIFPKVQKLYGGGAGDPGTIGQSNFATQNINGTTFNLVDYATDESWGPRYDPNISVLGWDAFDPEFPNEFLNPRPWVYPNADAESFYDVGVSLNNSISFSKSFEDSKLRLSFSNVRTTGIIPNSELEKTTISFSGSTKLSKKFRVDAGINYVITDGFNRPESGYGDNSLIQKFYQFGQTSLDYDRLRNYLLPNGNQRTWNRRAFDDPTPRFSDNPYWTIFENTSADRRNRWFGNTKFKYDFTDKISALGSIFLDSYDSKISTRVASGSQAQSRYDEDIRTFQELNYELRLQYNESLFEDKVSLNAIVGANRRNSIFSSLEGNTRGGLAVPGIYNLNNSNEDPRIIDTDEERRTNSIFASVSLGYKNFLYLDVTGRNDWSSTLPPENNSYFYPAVTGSFLFSQLVDAGWLSYGKVRGSWASVGNDTDPYSLRNTFESRSAFFGNIRYTQEDENKNPDLQPEEKTTWEVGLEMALFKNRVRLDVTYYDELTEDLITPLQVDPSTGYSSTFVNAGKLSNKGIEALVTVTPIQNENFTWDLTWNFSKNVNKLEELIPGVETLEIARFPFNGVTLNAVVGEPYGVIRGTNFVFDDQGNRVVDANGRFLESRNVENLGSVLPDYNMGIRNTLTYKNINFGFLIDIQEGGVYRSLTNIWGNYSGILEETAANNIREQGIILDGVTGDVTFNTDGSYTVANTAPNTTVLSAQQYGQDHFFRADAQNIFDASYIKLREVTLGYSLPSKWRGPLNSIKLSLFARNLFVWGLANDNFDPEVATSGSGNIQGSEGGSLPSTRNYGFNLQLKF